MATSIQDKSDNLRIMIRNLIHGWSHFTSAILAEPFMSAMYGILK